jgi:hypothetical protein
MLITNRRTDGNHAIEVLLNIERITPFTDPLKIPSVLLKVSDALRRECRWQLTWELLNIR